MNIIALACEKVVRLDRDLHIRVAGSAFSDSRATLTAQPQDLALLNPRRNRDVERAPVGQGQPFGLAPDGFKEFDGETILHILSASPSRTLGPTLEQLGKDVIGICKIGKAGMILVAMSTRGFGRKILIKPLLRRLGPRSVDVSPVESTAFVWIGDQVVCGRNLLEPLFKFPISRVEIGMQLLGELAIRFLYPFRRSSAFDAQCLIGVFHRRSPK
jgi:hypothetical protein